MAREASPLETTLNGSPTRVADLQRLRAVLKDLIGRCDQRSGKVACPITESLARQG